MYIIIHTHTHTHTHAGFSVRFVESHFVWLSPCSHPHTHIMNCVSFLRAHKYSNPIARPDSEDSDLFCSVMLIFINRLMRIIIEKFINFTKKCVTI